MVAPNRQSVHLPHRHAGFFRQTGLRPVFVQSRHGKPTVSRKLRAGLFGDPGVRVARISDHQHPCILGADLGDHPPLLDKDFSVQPQEFGPLHALFPGNAADTKNPVRPLESLAGIRGRHHLGQQGIGRVPDLHDHTLQSRFRGRDFQQLQANLLFRTE